MATSWASTRTSAPVWPRKGANQDEARIEPNTAYPLTTSLYRVSDLGRETLLFVASEIEAPVASLAQSGMRSAAARGAGSPFSRLLSASALTRGPESEIGTWGAQSRDLDVAGAKP